MINKLRIAILVDQLVSGGVQKAAIWEARELIKLGYQVTLFVLIKLKYDYQYEDLTDNLKVVYLSDFNPTFFKKAVHFPFFSYLTHLHLINPFFVYRYKFFKQYDLLISHGTTTCITAVAISRKYKLQYLAFIWDPLTFILEKIYGKHSVLKYFLKLILPIVKMYERDFLLGAALVVTPSKVHQKYLAKNYHVNPRVIYPGIEFGNTKRTRQGPYILGYTRWQLAKNPRFFLRLAQKFPHFKILIAGQWPDKKEEQIFRNEIYNLGLASHITLVSKVTREDLLKLAEQSFVWLHPHFEAFGMAGLEMAGLGLPLIIPNGSGITELFTDGIDGFFPNSLDIEEIGRYLELLFKNTRLFRTISKAVAKTTRKYTWKFHTLELLREIAHYRSQSKIVATINAFVTTRATGGGDRFFIELASRVPNSVYLTILLPIVGLPHFRTTEIEKPNIRFILLPPNIFDQHESPLAIFFAYIIRTLQTVILLPRLAPFKLLHTATDIFPDTVPAFFFRLSHPKSFWVARFFHFYAPPWKREGQLVRNTGSYLLQRLSLLLFKKSDLLLVDNPLLKNSISKILGPKINIVNSPGGVEVAKIQLVKPNPLYKSTAVFIGRLSAHKGVYDALEVWHNVCKKLPGVQLLLLGYCPKWEMKKIQEKAIELNIMESIMFPGFIHARQTVYEYLRSSKLLLFLDHEAGFGLVVAEAMAAGLPIVSYDLPIFGSVYNQGYVTVPLNDILGISDQVIKLLTKNFVYNDLSQAAKIQAQKLDWENSSKKFYKTLTPHANDF